MSDIAQRLRDVAARHCLPYVLALPRLAPYSGRLSCLLVGSVATGLCGEGSDIDIAVVCDPEVYNAIAGDTPWAEGRPSETEVGGVQLHYYAITFGAIESKLRELDDVALYVYGNALVLRDPERRYGKQFAWVAEHAERVRKERIEGKLDMLFRRARGLEQQLAAGDALAAADVCLELIRRCLKVAGLLDDVAFDPRKRLFAGALIGALVGLVTVPGRSPIAGLVVGSLGWTATSLAAFLTASAAPPTGDWLRPLNSLLLPPILGSFFGVAIGATSAALVQLSIRRGPRVH